jgi:hypothetical protein
MLTGEELRFAGFPSAWLAALVASGALRQGVTGYWLPEAPDPGALAVMRGALSDAEAYDND